MKNLHEEGKAAYEWMQWLFIHHFRFKEKTNLAVPQGDRM